MNISVVPTERTSEFVVRIEYREPTYEEVVGAKRYPYRWTMRVQARDPGEAQELARAEFRAMEMASSVGWVREIERVLVVVA